MPTQPDRFAFAAVKGPIGTLHRALAAARAELRLSLAPRTAAEARIIRAQMNTVHQSDRHHWLLLPAIGLLVLLNYRSDVSALRMLAWWLPMTATFTLYPYIRRRWLMPKPDATPPEVARAARLFTAWSGLLTIAWASVMPILWTPGYDIGNYALVFIISASMASAAAVNAVHFAAALATFLPFTAIFMLTPPLRDGHVDGLFVLLAGLYCLMTAAHMLAGYRSARRLLSLQDERPALIDDLKRAKAESDAARERAEHASQAKSQFLANMSHELRTPLNAILGFSEMIGAGVGDIEKTKGYARFINDSGQHLLALINDILDLAKIEAGGLTLRETEFRLADLVDEAARLMEQRARLGGLELRCLCATGLPVIQADERALKQVLLNLLSNAIKFTQPGGSVTAFVQRRDDGGVEFGVRDSGVGIAADDLERVFEKFGQGRHDIVTSDKSTGLGLAIVKGLIEAHGGTISLASREGEGTCVTATLPKARCAGEQMRKAG